MPNANIILTDALTTGQKRVDIAVVGSRIAEVAPAGGLGHTSGPGVRTIPLSGRLVTPGLWDSHIHLYHWCQMRHQLQLAPCRSRQDVLDVVASALPGESWLIGQGWNFGAWPDPTPPTRHELDVLTGERPALLWCSDLHSALANSAALAQAGLLHEWREVPGGVIERDTNGAPTGWLRELAANLVRDAVPPPDDAQMASYLLQAQTELHRLGVTGICDQRIKDINDGAPLFRVLHALELEGRWNLRTNLNVAMHHLDQARTLGMRTGFGSDRLRLGHLKIFADGTLGSMTARMLQPFKEGGTGDDGRGLYLTSPDEMRPTFVEAARAGFSLSVHAIGDEANRLCLDLFQELDQLGIPRPRIPHRIEHAQMLDDADVARFAELGLAVSVQAGHLLDDRHGADRALGERARICYRFGDLWRAQANLIFGTDAPVSEVDPRYGLRAAAHRCVADEQPWFPEQRLPAEAIWQGYTSGAAAAAGWDDLVGTLAPGQRADLVVWDGDPLEPGLAKPAEVLQTLFDGKLVFERE